MTSKYHPKEAKKTIETQAGKITFFKLSQVEKLGLPNPSKLPFSIKILLECVLRNFDDYQITFNDIKKIASWKPKQSKPSEIAFKPGRVILQDFTGVPCVVDLAAMRSAMKHMGGDYRKINPQVQCDLVIDHSLQIDAYGTNKAFDINLTKEFKRNKERYEFLKWGQKAFKNFRVVPPSTGIIHQVNLEYLAKGVLTKRVDRDLIVYPDSLVGTDSHTTMINGLGVVGWGVGGIEAEAVMLGEPIYMVMPEVIGFKLKGILNEGVTATDMVLTIVEMLRKKGVVGKFVEFFGEGVTNLSLPDRATVANMGPEYGATMGLFPIDEETLRYYRMSGRKAEDVDLIERYMKEQGMFYSPMAEEPEYSSVVELDLSTVEPSLAGPKRPQDRVTLKKMKQGFKKTLKGAVKERGFALSDKDIKKKVTVDNKAKDVITHGAVVIASITSCTNTSNPSVLIGAALLARNALKLGLKVKDYVKTSFAPGSQVVEEYLEAGNLMQYLEGLGFHNVGYGCATCIGNSGPLKDSVVAAIEKGDLVAASVLSGNRNFEGRISPHIKANYLASPPLVVAYALAGTVDIDLSKDALGEDVDGKKLFLKDIWPSQQEINELVAKTVTSKAFKKRYNANVLKGDKNWQDVKEIASDLYSWKTKSTYIQEPPFFTHMEKDVTSINEINNAQVLVMVGDSITTDHISPAGAIAQDSPAGQYLQTHKISPENFNSYGSRRGNDHVMTRGTFANIRLRNLLAPGTEGSWTTHFPSKKTMSIYDAAMSYKHDNVPLIILAGKEYGTGSSRDWAAKGTALLGVKAVIAQSYERIHRSNLVGMGVLPLQFKSNSSAESLGLKGDEQFDIVGLDDKIKPQQDVTVVATGKKGAKKKFKATVRLDTAVDIDYYRNGGILQTVLRKLSV